MSHYQEATVTRDGDVFVVTVRSGNAFVCDAVAGHAPGAVCADPRRIADEMMDETLTAMGFRIVGRPGAGERVVARANSTNTFWDVDRHEWRAYSGDSQEKRPPLKVKDWMHRGVAGR